MDFWVLVFEGVCHFLGISFVVEFHDCAVSVSDDHDAIVRFVYEFADELNISAMYLHVNTKSELTLYLFVCTCHYYGHNNHNPRR